MAAFPATGNVNCVHEVVNEMVCENVPPPPSNDTLIDIDVLA